MGRRYRQNEADFSEFFASITVLFLFVCIGLYYYNRPLFYEVISVVTVTIVVVITLVFYWNKRREEQFEKTYELVRKNHSAMIINFIDQFGRTKPKEAAFTHQQYAFTRERLGYVQDELEKNGIRLSHRDFFRVLRWFIDDRERNFTVKAIHGEGVRRFDDLNGSQFEVLVKRLYEKAGYTVQLTGRTGDQGGDLVVVRDTEKKVIQAKLRRNMTVGNDAVQQVVAAKGIYNCPAAVVITNSTFTPEAEELARIHTVELVDGKLLRTRLQETLNESWN